MPTALIEQFANPKRSARLTELMNACKHHYRIITVMAIGCGDAFINRYWPKLELLVNQGLIKLTIADKGDLKELIAIKIEKASHEPKSARELELRYENLLQVIAQRPSEVRYLNVDDPECEARYEHLTQDLVFVLVPDDIHIKHAGHWLKRAVLVLIEKPYNYDFNEANNFEKALQQMVRLNGERNPHTFVVCIDHYLAKIFRYVLRHREEALQRQIGVIREIEFSVCEAGGVEPWRAPTLGAGMIYDLFCHVLALISPFVNLKSFFQGDGDPEVLVACHVDCPIRNESFAHINHPGLLDFQGRRLALKGSLGKGVGGEDVKFLRIVGERGTLTADFGPASHGKLTLITNTGTPQPLFDIGKGHPEILDAIFEGRFVEEPVGGLTGETALDTLEILTSLRTKVDRRSQRLHEKCYPVGTTPDDIIKDIAVRL